MDLYELFNADDEPTAQERARAVAMALRRQQAVGMVGASSQNDLINPAGRALLVSAHQGQGALADAGQQRSGQRLRRTLEAEAAQRAEANAQRERSFHLQDAATQRAFQAEQNGLSRASQEKAAALSAGQRVEAATRGTVIPGLEVSRGAAPTAEDAKKVKASLASAERMKRYVQELKGIHGGGEGTAMVGENATRMGQLVKAIQLEGKNIGELGALSGPDMGLIEDLVGADPTSFGNNLKALVGSDNTQAALSGVEKWVDDTLGANMQTYGYERPAPSQPAGRTPPPSQAPKGASAAAAPEALVLNGARYVRQPDGTYLPE